MSKPEAAPHPRKLKITEAAITCFIEQGYNQTGVRDIAEKAGISLGNLYNHFKGKEALLVFIAELESDDLGNFAAMLTDRHHPPEEALQRFISAYARYCSKPENGLLGIEILAEAIRNQEVAKIFGKNKDILTEALSACLDEGMRLGRFELSSGKKEIAGLILGAIEDFGVRCLLETPRPAATTIEKFILSAISASP